MDCGCGLWMCFSVDVADVASTTKTATVFQELTVWLPLEGQHATQFSNNYNYNLYNKNSNCHSTCILYKIKSVEIFDESSNKHWNMLQFTLAPSPFLPIPPWKVWQWQLPLDAATNSMVSCCCCCYNTLQISRRQSQRNLARTSHWKCQHLFHIPHFPYNFHA